MYIKQQYGVNFTTSQYVCCSPEGATFSASYQFAHSLP